MFSFFRKKPAPKKDAPETVQDVALMTDEEVNRFISGLNATEVSAANVRGGMSGRKIAETVVLHRAAQK